jgi:two-component system, cell cycle response regulator
MTEKKLRVLLAEGTPGEAANALHALYPDPDSKLELSIVSTIPTTLATIELASPEAILFDLSLGRPEPLDAVRRIRRAAPGIPLIVFADPDDKNDAIRSVSAGALDYLLKGFMDPRTVERVLRMALERNTLEGLADLLRDQLTGLYNRDGFMTLGTRAMEAAMRSGGTLVLLCALIENLSVLRAEAGASGVEQALLEATDLLKSCFRRSDVVARLGDAQFAALAVDAAEPSASVLRQRVESRLSIHRQMRQPWSPLELRLSVGYWGASDSRSFGEFLDAVEAQLRQPAAALSETGAGEPSVVGHR